MMASVATESWNVEQLAASISAFAEEVAAKRGTAAIKPGHRVAFHWPPHPVSYGFHVLASDWTGKATFVDHGETFDVEVAKTPYGVFGRCVQLWHEARGSSEPSMLNHLKEAAQPLFHRQFAISECLGLDHRFTGHIRELDPLALLKLLYCSDRDVANEARTEIETRGGSQLYTEALIQILRDRSHPFRRSAQWCVLDLFEDLHSFAPGEEQEAAAIAAMKSLLWDASDDYARAVFKAGVVLGGHLPGEKGGPVLIECLAAPSRIGRRSAIHGLFHVVEWEPSTRASVITALREGSMAETEPALRAFGEAIATDIEAGAMEHVAEPLFEDEE